MKRSLFLFLLISGLGITMVPEINAFSFKDKETGFRFNVEDGSASLLGVPAGIHDIIIPEVVSWNGNSYEVVGIDNKTFEEIEVIHNLTIHSNIKYIDSQVFKNTTVYNLFIDSMESWLSMDFKLDLVSTHHPSFSCNANPISPVTSLYVDNKLVKELVIPEGIETIPHYAFRYLNLSGNLSLPQTIDYIESYAFADCKFNSIDFPENLRLIGNNAFFNCSFEEIKLPESLEYIGISAFSGNPITKIILPYAEKWLEIGKGEMYYDYGWGSWEGGFPFTTGHYNLYVGDDAIEDFAVPGAFEKISNMEFENSLIKSVSFEEGVKRVGLDAFQGCVNLETISYPSTIEYISLSFGGENLKSIEIKSLVPPATPSGYEYRFYEYPSEWVTENCILYVPVESVNDYKAHSIWGLFKHIEGKDFNSSSKVDNLDYEDINKNDILYNLNGQRVLPGNEKSGIYIRNGKKVII